MAEKASSPEKGFRRILSGGVTKWLRRVEGDRTDKPQPTMNRGSRHTGEGMAEDSPFSGDTAQQPRTEKEYPRTVQCQERDDESYSMRHHPSQTAQDLHRNEEPYTMLDPPPTTGAGQHLPTDTNQQMVSQGSGDIAMVKVEDLETDDIVIAIMGPTGSGKSTFIRVASGHDTQGVGHSLRSFTSEVIAIRFWDQENGRHVVLVDTPGFDDTSRSDLDILDMISQWLNTSYKNQKLLDGILYLHRITDNRMAGTPLKNLRVFRKLCGKDALDKVYLTTTMWDEVDQTVGGKRLKELEQEYWKSMITQGAQIVRCRNDNDSPKKIIQQILDREAARKTLLLQREMSVLEKELKETEAGQELYSQLEKLIERQLTLLQRIDKERRTATDPDALAGLQIEYNELRVQIDDRLRQMQELKLSRFQNIFRYFTRKRERG